MSVTTGTCCFQTSFRIKAHFDALDKLNWSNPCKVAIHSESTTWFNAKWEVVVREHFYHALI